MPAAYRQFPQVRSTDPLGVEILADPEFYASCRALSNTSLLDTPRLANLWALCRETDPAGAIIEIGSYKGGGALHLSRCCPDRKVFACEAFSPESFERVDQKLDTNFQHGQFADHSEEAVRRLLAGRNAEVIPGFFPDSVRGRDLPPISFVHLDVDVYEATKNSLLYLFDGNRLLPRSLVVLDDYNRKAAGVNMAVEEVGEELGAYTALPMFPGQAVLIPHTFRAGRQGSSNGGNDASSTVHSTSQSPQT
jgi:hypothetical protein